MAALIIISQCTAVLLAPCHSAYKHKNIDIRVIGQRALESIDFATEFLCARSQLRFFLGALSRCDEASALVYTLEDSIERRITEQMITYIFAAPNPPNTVPHPFPDKAVHSRIPDMLTLLGLCAANLDQVKGFGEAWVAQDRPVPFPDFLLLLLRVQ